MKPKSNLDAAKALGTLRLFLNPNQRRCLADLCRSEERQYFVDKLCELADLVAAMPHTYGQEGKANQTVAYLHYFTAGMDCWITEKDVSANDGTPAEQGHHQAFGLACMGYEEEIGYISLVEWLANGAELDLHFKPQTLEELQRSRNRANVLTQA